MQVIENLPTHNVYVYSYGFSNLGYRGSFSYTSEILILMQMV